MDVFSYKDLYFDYDLKLNNLGDLEQAGDKRQSIILRLRTPYGANIFHPGYGNKIFDILSDSMDGKWLNKAINYEKECMEQDPTIKVLDIKAVVNQAERKVNFTIEYMDTDVGEIGSIMWGENIG